MKIKNQRENFTAASFHRAIEKMHGCKASWVEEVPVKESFKDERVWDGTVHVFDLTGHPEATRADTWSWRMPGRSKHTYFAVLKLPPVFSPRDAVRAAIVQEYRTRHDPKR